MRRDRTVFHRPLFALMTVLVSASCERQGDKATQRDSTSVAVAVVAVPAVPPSETVGSGSINWQLENASDADRLEQSRSNTVHQ